MAKAVLTHKPVSIYDDLPEERYHFTRKYLRQVEQALGDLIVYYEPGRTRIGDAGRTGRSAYVAVAQLARIEPDGSRADHFYACMEPGSYFVLDRPVSFREDGRYHEDILRRSDGGTSKGAFGRAVRSLTDGELEGILRTGFARELTSLESEWDLPQPLSRVELDEPPALFERPIVEQVLARPMRDAAFKRAVRDAYGMTCAVTGLRLTNGHGRPEVQAAHIRPVQHKGPDSVRNGIALSATFHWMFDRGLISFGPPPRYDVLVTSKGLPDSVMQMINRDRRLLAPASTTLQHAGAG